MNEDYERRVKAYLAQSQWVDSLGNHYKKLYGHLWVLRFYKSVPFYPMVAWSKVEGWTTPTIYPRNSELF